MVDVHGFGGVPRRRAEQLRELLAIPPLDGAAEELPAIADVDPDGELGNDAPILYNRSSRGFVRSPWVEEDLDEALRDRKVILLAGRSESGKWRTAWEAVGRVLPDARLLVPRLGMPVLAELLSLDPPLRPGPGPVVVWLDRLDAYLATGSEMVAKTMERLQSLAPRIVILACVRGDVHVHLLGSQVILGPVARQLLGEAVTIVVPAPGTPARRGRAGTGRSNADEERPDGTGAPTADTTILERRYRDGRAGRDADGRADRTSRIGWMLVQAAADWRRMGMFRAVTERELRELAARYADPGRHDQALDDARWDAALQWALASPPGATASLLQEVPPDAAEDQGEPGARAFQPAEFLASDRAGPEQATSADGWPQIPDAAWEFVLRRCDPFELIGVSTAADKDAAPATAEAALRRAMRSLDASSASMAGLLLAGRLESRGDTEGAIAAYRQCIADGEHVVPEFPERSSGAVRGRGAGRSREMEAGPAMTAFACVNLGSLLSREGRLQEAAEVWRKGMAYQDPGGVPLCAMNLGGLLAKNRDLRGARDAYEQALAAYTRHGDPDKMHGMAAVDLGFILIELGEENAARAAFETAIHSGHRVAAPRAAAMLGMILLVSDHDEVSAKRAFGVAAGADDPNVAMRARLELAKLEEQAEPDEAISDYHALTECSVQDVAGEALLRMGVLLYDVRKDWPAAEKAFRKVMQCDDLLRKSKAAMALGRLLLEQQDWGGARDALQLAANAPEPGTAGFALVFLGDALAMLGQPDEAWRTYFRASRSANPRVAQLADDRLERRAWQRGGVMSDGGTDRSDGSEPGGADPVAGRLDAVAEALVSRQLTVWRQDVYHDNDGDGTGEMGWLWLRAGQRTFPARDHDVLLQYSSDEREWQASTPDGRTRRVADAGPEALAAAVAAFVADQPEDPGIATPGETPESVIVSGKVSRLPPAETLRNLPDWITMILGGITTAVVIPFVGIFATTGAADLYKKIKDILSRDQPPEPIAAASTGYVRVTDDDADVQLIYPEPIPPRAVEKLVKKLIGRDLSELRGCTLVWDNAREDWFLCRLA